MYSRFTYNEDLQRAATPHDSVFLELGHLVGVHVVLAGNSVPRVLDRVLHVFPGTAGALLTLEFFPPAPKIGFHVIPLASEMMLARFEAVLVCRTEFFIITAGGVGP